VQTGAEDKTHANKKLPLENRILPCGFTIHVVECTMTDAIA